MLSRLHPHNLPSDQSDADDIEVYTELSDIMLKFPIPLLLLGRLLVKVVKSWVLKKKTAITFLTFPT